MMFSPESFPIIEGHEPAASNAISTGCAAVNLGNADGVWIIVHEDYAVDANQLVMTIKYGATSALAVAGATGLTATWGGWYNLTAQSSDAITALTPANSFTLDAAAGGNCLWMFYIPGAIVNYRWIKPSFAAGDAGNIASVMYILDRARYKSSAPSGNGSYT